MTAQRATDRRSAPGAAMTALHARPAASTRRDQRSVAAGTIRGLLKLRRTRDGDTLHPSWPEFGTTAELVALLSASCDCLVGARSHAGLFAQRNQPIYPAYDGFLKNPDGSYTLAFAYFSHNAEPVTIPPGAEQQLCARSRRSAAADRVQARSLALPVRDGGRPRLRRQDALDADLRRHDDGHERADAAVELEPGRRRGRARADRLSRRRRAACA